MGLMGCPKITYDYQEEGLEKSTVHFFGQLGEKRGQQKNRINYYPFGLTFNSYQRSYSKSNNFKYNGKEEQEETGWYDYGARMYQADLGRFTSVDPLSDFENQESWTGYHYTLNNPISRIDPTGMLSTDVVENEDGTYTVVGGDAEDGDKGIYVVSQNEEGDLQRTGEVIGESITTHSFFGDDGEAVVGAVIDTESTEGKDFILDEIIADDPNLVEYMPNATGGEKYDLKTRGIENRGDQTIEQYMYRGSKSRNRTYGSARDFGNMGAGIVAARNGLDWSTTRLGFDGLQSVQEGKVATEGITSQAAQLVGFMIGIKLRNNDKK